MIVLASCQTNTHQKDAISIKSNSTNETDSSLKINREFPLPITYTSDVKADTMFLYFGSDKILITPKGKAFKNNELFFDIQPEGNIQKLFPIVVGDDIIVFYVFSPVDGEAGSFAKRISLKGKNMIWETPVYGFNLARPIVIEDYAYLSTIGFVGKLNISDGKFIWKLDNLNKNGKYICFNEPVFYKDSCVLFTECNAPEIVRDYILINDRNGSVLKKK